MSRPNPTWTAVSPTALKFVTSLLLLAAIAVSPAALAADGYANVNGTTTGGAGGPTVTVSNFTDLVAAIEDDAPRIVNVNGTINLGSSNVRFGSNKSLPFR